MLSRINDGLKRFVTSRASGPSIDHDPESLYNYSAGRWLWNEKSQLARRRREFNVTELVHAAAPAVGSRSCIKLIKLSEGTFNKAFLLTMDDGKEIVAKLPNPNAGYKHLTTASEVATMDYVRNILDIPAPQVYAWNSSSQNPVGAEYIFMEKCSGVELHKVWNTITERQKAEIITKLVNYEAAFVSSTLPAYGSLYYAKDLDSKNIGHTVVARQGKGRNSSKFAIGPTTDRHYFDHDRADATSNRGPWSTVEECNLAIAEREIACLQRSEQFPDPQGFYNGPGQYQQTPELKRHVLRNFERVAQYLKPKDPVLSKPVLWHTDLHWDNIFVDEDDPTKITAIIDWQAVHVAPLFVQARHPKFLEFEGEIPDTFDANAIPLPDNFADLSTEEQDAAKKLRAAQLLWKFYEIELVCKCKDVTRATRFGDGLQGQLPTFAGNVFSDGELLVQDHLINLQQNWDQVIDDTSTDPCPLSFTAEEIAVHEQQYEHWTHSIGLMTDFLERMGGYRGWDGWVSHEQYDMAKAHMMHYKEDFIAQHSSTEAERKKWLDVWPFRD